MKKILRVITIIIGFPILCGNTFGECVNQGDGGTCEEGYYSYGGQCCDRPENTCTGDMEYGILSGDRYVCSRCEDGITVPDAKHLECVCDIYGEKCCGVELNTVVPFIGDCIEFQTNSDAENPVSQGEKSVVTQFTAFPILMQGMMKIVLSVILIFSFLMIIIAGLLMTSGVFKQNLYSKGTDIIKKVLISLILLGCSGLILSLINPSFFGG